MELNVFNTNIDVILFFLCKRDNQKDDRRIYQLATLVIRLHCKMILK